MAPGPGSTVTITLAEQPEAIEYDMVVVPAVTGVTTPVAGFMAATAGELLVHVPPATTSDNVEGLPDRHKNSVPEIGAGDGFTVTTTGVAV